ncbi:hypothetical protein [Microbacterium sp. TNHR37B]|uniref:hypothetical protein n=1 Tax=Microbacterium sp. TNHR37B TaxID=1775956 RepID=UPI0007B1CE5E|nr:hypothetical protein [Microbacterium sp. TNHR37B]KZE90630.1 hypothetical protein AVP41_00149 [Microbacterium sp. TNHR37B]
MTTDPFSDDGIDQVKRILDEIETSRPGGTDGTVVTDRQTQQLLRALRILTDLVEQLREQAP